MVDRNSNEKFIRVSMDLLEYHISEEEGAADPQNIVHKLLNNLCEFMWKNGEE